jgi:hypothetical protein
MADRATAAAAATALRRVKRAQGLIRTAAALLAEARTLADADLVAEVHLDPGQTDLAELVEVLDVARSRGGALDVVVLASPRQRTDTRHADAQEPPQAPARHAPRPAPDRLKIVG